MKGEEKLWSILNDKLETLRASSRLPEAIRVAETLLELAKRTFGDDDNSLALSYEKLGQLLDQSGDGVKAKPYLLKAHGVLENREQGGLAGMCLEGFDLCLQVIADFYYACTWWWRGRLPVRQHDRRG